jgi:signal peptidase II
MTGADDAAAPAPAPARRKLPLPAVTGLIVVAVVVADQLTKHWVVSTLDDGRAHHVLWTLQWNLSYNTGMAFSQARGIGPVIGVVALVVIIALGLGVRRVDRPVTAVAAGLIVGGATGNLADRLFRGDGWLHGAVVDFVDLQWFPIFNVADSAITIGGIMFVLWSLRHGEGARS